MHRYAKDWPGAKTLPQDIGRRTIRVARPEAYFDVDNPDWPDVVELQIHMPESLENRFGAEEARHLVAEHERKALAEPKRRDIPFKGVPRLMRTPHTARARSYEVFGKINPRFSAAGGLELARKNVAENRSRSRARSRARRSALSAEGDGPLRHSSRPPRVVSG